MSQDGTETIHEVDFCAQIAASATNIFHADPDSFPFNEARIEGFGKKGSLANKRKDLRFYDAFGALLLTGETKLPGPGKERDPYDETLVRDAQQKADDADVRYFFTWNVNTFVLWDRKLWDVPLLDRRVKEWRLERYLSNAQAVALPSTLEYLKTKFLPSLLSDLANICTQKVSDWGMAPDDIFIRSLESHLDWPGRLLRDWLLSETERSRVFDTSLQAWMASQDWAFVRNDLQKWSSSVDTAARSLSYILTNRFIFYKALADKFGDLPALQLGPHCKTPDLAYSHIQSLFKAAVKRSGDYEPLFYPDQEDWASKLVFQAPGALDAWRSVLKGIQQYDFRSIRSDVVGRIFQKLISPEERSRFGQYFTGDDAVDLINSFCIRDSNAIVIDPACGSGSFLVRAYYRKKFLGWKKPHQELLEELLGCDISLYPAHLATLNLAAREINEEANYPLIARKDFFQLQLHEPFCKIPDGKKFKTVSLPTVDVVVGNPPYLKQEKIPNKTKTLMRASVERAWQGLVLSGRSDLHCYFWPVATSMLRESGYFGFLTSSAWLDVEYGFALQGWILQNFKIITIMESAAESWFSDARVKTCVTILQKCADCESRMSNTVKFVSFNSPLSKILTVSPGEGSDRQKAIDILRDKIESVQADSSDSNMRISLIPQAKLWDDGLRAAGILQRLPMSDDDEEELGEDAG